MFESFSCLLSSIRVFSCTKAQWKWLMSQSLSMSPPQLDQRKDLVVPAVNLNFKLALPTLHREPNAPYIYIINALQSENNMRKRKSLRVNGFTNSLFTFICVSAWIAGNVVLLHPKHVEKSYFTKQNLHFPPPPHHIHHHIHYPHFPVISKGLLHLSQAPALQPAAALS